MPACLKIAFINIHAPILAASFLRPNERTPLIFPLKFAPNQRDSIGRAIHSNGGGDGDGDNKGGAS